MRLRLGKINKANKNQIALEKNRLFFFPVGIDQSINCLRERSVTVEKGNDD